MLRALTLAASLLLAGLARAGEVDVVQAKTDGRHEIVVAMRNTGTDTVQYELSAGTVFRGADGTGLATLCRAILLLAPGQLSEVSLPAALLTLPEKAAIPELAHLTAEQDPRLDPLLKYLRDKPDVPRGTSQCAVLMLTQDITFAQWQAAAAVQNPAPEAAADALIEALDAVGILRAIAPAQSFRLTTDPELKLRALRQPALRSKALQLFGLTIPGEAPPGQTPPDLGQLLHTKPGDNCPICRMRAQMQRPASDL